MIVYGRNAVRELLRGRRSHAVGAVWATRAAADEVWLAGVEVHVVDSSEVARRAGSDAHQGICADAGGYPYAGVEELLGGVGARRLILALDEVQDPQNLGAICRTAECAGVHGVVICERRAAHVTGAVCKASAGAVEHLRIARAPNMASFLERAKEAGWWCYGASARDAEDYRSVDFAGDAVLVLGAEGRGLRPRVASVCDTLVSLPMSGRIDSLNVSAAAAVLMYAVLQGKTTLDTGS